MRIRSLSDRRELLATIGALPAIAVLGAAIPALAASYGVLKVVWVMLALIAAMLAVRDLKITIAVLFVALAFPFSTKVLLGLRLHTTHVLLLLMVGQLAFGAAFGRYKLPRGLLTPVLVMIFGALVGAIAGPDLGGSVLRLAGGLLPALLAGVATAVVVRSERDLELLVKIGAAALIGTSLLALAQSVGAAPGALASQFGSSRVNGLFEHPNDLGAYISVMMLLFVGVLAYTRARLTFAPAALAAIVLAIPALATTLSRGALLGLAVGLLVELAVLARRGRALALLATLAVIAGGAFVVSPTVPESKRVAYIQRFQKLTNPTAETGRALIYSEAERVIRQYPLTGVGPLTFGAIISRRTQLPLLSEQLGHAHDLLLEGYLSIGPLGLLAFFLLLARVLASLLRATRVEDSIIGGWAVGALGAVAAILAQSVADFLFHQQEMLVLFMMLIGSAFAVQRMREHQPARE